MLMFARKLQLKTICLGLIAVKVGIGLLICAASYQTLTAVAAISRVSEQLLSTTDPKGRALYEMRAKMGYGGVHYLLKNMILRHDSALGAQVYAAIDEVERLIITYRSFGVSQQEANDLSVLQDMIKSYRGRVAQSLEMIKSGAGATEIDAAIAYDDARALAAFDELRTVIGAARSLGQDKTRSAIATATAFTRATAIAMGLSLIVFAGFLMLFLRSRLMSPLSALVAHVKRIGGGDLSDRIHLEAQDEVGILATAVNEMTDSLETLTTNARDASTRLSVLANETLAATRQQATSVTEQFASLQQVAATVEEIVQSGEQISAKARDVLRAARATAQKGKDGLHSVQAMSGAMGAIRIQTELVARNILTLSEHTKAIGDIIATVTDVAQRSDLLALNAAIEAAAAGEHGRSFAVVAEEIKAMAEQSKAATSQITDILRKIHDGINTSVMLNEESVKRVESGNVRADEALASIGDMTENLRLSIGAFELSVSATNQQKIGLDQVAAALQQIRSGGEQTASGTRQIELAVNDITALSSQLDQTIKRYAA